jgi:hypothetical protein
MTTAPDPSFDPLVYPARDRVIPDWAAAGPTPNWWVNLVAHSIRRGEARVLLRAGNVLRVTYAGDGPLDVEELP